MSVFDHQEWVATSEKPILLEFGATWCPPCKAMKPIVERFKAEHDEVDVVEYDVDEAQEIAALYNVASVPTFILMKDGKVAQYKAGAMSKHSLEVLAGVA